VLPLGIVLVLSSAAVLLNPNGARMFVYPFETLTSAAMQRYIQEWFSPDFHQVEWLPFALLLVALVGTTLLGRARVPLAQVILLVLLGLLALRSARNVPLFVLVAVPVLSIQLAAWIPLRIPVGRPSPVVGIVNLILAGVLILAALVRIAGVLMNQPLVEREKFPEAAVNWIVEHRPAPNLYNSYGWGGYLIWRLYPEYQVYIDGRADVHGDVFIEDFLEIYRGEAGWADKLVAQDVRLVLVEPHAPLARYLEQDSQWKKAYADELAVIYERE
jgi:hypothetical protein